MAEVKHSTGTFFIPWVSTLKNVMYCMSESPSFMPDMGSDKHVR